MNPYYPPPPWFRMPSSPAPVLGKRKHEDPPALPLSAQFDHVGDFSPQVLGPVFPANQFQEPLSPQTMMSRYQGPQSTLPERTVASNTNTARHSIFIVNTIESMQHGEEPSINPVAARETTPVTTPRPHQQPLRPRRPILHPSKPLQNSEQVHAGVWVDVLSFCEPKFLLEAKTLNRFFYNLLSDNSAIWRKSRINHYGVDMPECPKGLSEKQYVELLAGRGCQSKGCHVDRTSKVHWTFQARLCPNCFNKKTATENDLAHHRRHRLPAIRDHVPPGDGRALWQLLPLVSSDGRRDSHSCPVDTEAHDWGQHSGKFAFLKTSYAKIESEYWKFRVSGATHTAMMAWARKIHRETMEYMAEVNKIEAWLKEYTKTVQGSKSQAWRQRRIEYFEARAAELSPPIDRKILWKMAAFTGNLKVGSDPTPRSWESLRLKIEPYRMQAQYVEDFERLMESEFLETVPQVRLFRLLDAHRGGKEAVPRSYQPEQKFVLQLAHAEFVRCVNDGVADEDLLLLCLRNVFETYSTLENRPMGFNFDGTTGPYRLSLDDARMIVKDVIERHVQPHSERGRIVLQSLKCQGCQRKDHIRTWSFVEGFEHILQTHARQVGKGLEYYQFATPHPVNDMSGLSPREGGVEYKFPWYTVAWPRNLPLVPRHQDLTQLGAWSPTGPTEFTPLPARLRVSAFHGRQPLKQQHAADAFGPNLVYAAQQLYGVRLDGRCQMKIALRYALDLYAQKHTTEPPLSAFWECLDDLATVNPGIELKFQCGICEVDDRRPGISARRKQKTAMDRLQMHWEHKHREGSVSWTQGLMYLPSDQELTQHIAEIDKKLQGEKDAVLGRAAVMSTDIKKRAKSKGSVLLGTKQASEVFDALFFKVEAH
ncbi:hypothetical protein AYL99_04615 [Fonsecaea erecta]|uniref:DUF7892 domain-containing protein n=1 Tax=Fonsecaea erecta TaxID=1367422 RepID=A0A178ZRW1_9EURO|nr:hypothetical protein AYL99_04615 [Fonsecaea erecta]OAP62412.1 hypothetical protein AYL99_04615 [Fonsecaea erecta]